MTLHSYRGMNRVALDLAYNNIKAEPNYLTTMAQFKERGDFLYRSLEVQRDIAYGDRPRQRFDWLACGRSDAPTFLFIHGGYWQNYTKEDLAFVASGALERGFNVVLAEYTLAPEATMTEIASEIGLLIEFLQAGNGKTGFGRQSVCLCGHSAGSQLAALYRNHPAITLTVTISALFDLEPFALSWLNDKLRLTSQEVTRFSPYHNIRIGTPVIVSLGTAELPELMRQSTDYADACTALGKKALLLPLRGQTHFSILNDMADPFGAHMSAIADALFKLR